MSAENGNSERSWRISPDTADTRVYVWPKELYAIARRIARRNRRSYSEWVSWLIWQAASNDIDERHAVGKLRGRMK